MKKYTALILALMMVFTCLAACGGSGDDGKSEVVMSIEGYDVTFDEFMYYLQSSEKNLMNYYGVADGSGIEWDQTCTYDKSVTNAEWCVNEALYTAAQGCFIQKKAAELDAGLTDEQNKDVEDGIQEYIDSYKDAKDPKAAFEKDLSASGLTIDTLKKISVLNREISNLFVKMYGENGENLAEDVFNEFVEKYGYMTSAHILFQFTASTKNADGTVTTDNRSAAEIERGKAKLESYVEELRAISDDNERKTKFLELMQSESEDPGKVNYPNGYCFTEGTMVEVYTETTKALKNYEVSDVVESNYGYHIIMRLPTAVTDIDMRSTDGSSLGQTASSYAFNKEIDSWGISDAAKLNSAYKDFDFTQFFGSQGFVFVTHEQYVSGDWSLEPKKDG